MGNIRNVHGPIRNVPSSTTWSVFVAWDGNCGTGVIHFDEICMMLLHRAVVAHNQEELTQFEFAELAAPTLSQSVLNVMGLIQNNDRSF